MRENSIMSIEFVKQYSSSSDKSSKSSVVSTPSASSSKAKNSKTLQQSKSGTSAAIKQVEKESRIELQIYKEQKDTKESKISKEELDTKESKESSEIQSVKEVSYDSKLSSAKPAEEIKPPTAYQSVLSKKSSNDNKSDEKKPERKYQRYTDLLLNRKDRAERNPDKAKNEDMTLSEYGEPASMHSSVLSSSSKFDSVRPEIPPITPTKLKDVIMDDISMK